MKLKMTFFVFLVVVIILDALPAYASDFSGYTKAIGLIDWTWRDGVGHYAKVLFVQPRSGEMMKWVEQFYIKNIGNFPLTDAVYLIGIIQVRYTDQAGVVHTITDPVEIAQLVRLENSEEMWQGNYVIWLGTIKPGHSKRLMFNWWYAENLEIWYESNIWQGVWYLQ